MRTQPRKCACQHTIKTPVECFLTPGKPYDYLACDQCLVQFTPEWGISTMWYAQRTGRNAPFYLGGYFDYILTQGPRWPGARTRRSAGHATRPTHAIVYRPTDPLGDAPLATVVPYLPSPPKAGPPKAGPKVTFKRFKALEVPTVSEPSEPTTEEPKDTERERMAAFFGRSENEQHNRMQRICKCLFTPDPRCPLHARNISKE